MPLGTEPRPVSSTGAAQTVLKELGALMSACPAMQELGQLWGQVSTHLGSLLELL